MIIFVKDLSFFTVFVLSHRNEKEKNQLQYKL